MSLILNKVAGHHTETFFKKEEALPNILEHLSYKTRRKDRFCKTSSCFSRQPQPQNVTVDLVFFFLL